MAIKVSFTLSERKNDDILCLCNLFYPRIIFIIITFSGLEKELKLIMLSESIFEYLKPMPKATDEINYKDDQVYEDVDGYEPLRKIFK